ncbi:MAG TPA: response regulator transcription factor [Burkholderiaceae bacterium]
MKNLILVDDHAVVRAGYRRLLESEPDLVIVGECGNAEEALEMLARQACCLLILDASLPGKSGLDLLRRVTNRWPDLPVLILSMHEYPSVAAQALRLGARGYVTKASDSQTLVQAVRHVLTGRVFLSPDIMMSLPEFLGAASNTIQRLGLGPRELDVVRLLSEGRTLADTALSMGISSKTVSNYLSQIKSKLALNTDFELAFWAWTNGVASAPPLLGDS